MIIVPTHINGNLFDKLNKEDGKLNKEVGHIAPNYNADSTVLCDTFRSHCDSICSYLHNHAIFTFQISQKFPFQFHVLQAIFQSWDF